MRPRASVLLTMISSAPKLRSVRVGCGCGAADGLGMRCLDRWSDTAGTMPGSPGKLMQPDRPFNDPDQSPWPQPAAAAGPDGRPEQTARGTGGKQDGRAAWRAQKWTEGYTSGGAVTITKTKTRREKGCQ